jgi:predicted acetyltransferase
VREAAAVSLPLVPLSEKSRLARSMGAYIAEMSAIIGVEPLAAYPYFDAYWREPNRWPYWIRVGSAEAGFALIDRADDGRFEVAEFFVARPYRRQGVGLIAARELIGSRPGSWRVTQRHQNDGAIAFWHRVYEGFVSYTESVVTTDAVRRVQLFTVPG